MHRLVTPGFPARFAAPFSVRRERGFRLIGAMLATEDPPDVIPSSSGFAPLLPLPAQDTGPLLPPPSTPINPPFHPAADQMLLDWPRYYQGLGAEEKSQTDLMTGNPDDPEGTRKRYVNTRFLMERLHLPGPDVVNNYETARAQYAAQAGWGDAGFDDAKFHQRATKEATKLRDHQVSLVGIEGDNEEARMARENSAANKGYMTGTGAFDEGPLTGFERFEKTHPKLSQDDPKERSERWQTFARAWSQGKNDVKAAREAADKVFPAFLTGDSDELEKALPVIRGLTQQQVGLLVTEMKAREEKGPEETNAPGRVVLAGARATKRLGESIAGFLSDSNYQDYRAGQMVDAEALKKGIGEAVEDDVRNTRAEISAAGGSMAAGAFPVQRQGTVALTDAQAKAANAYVAQKHQDQALLFRMRQIADGEINAISGSYGPGFLNAVAGFTEAASTGIASAAPVMAASLVPVVGPVATSMAFAHDAAMSLEAQGVSRGTAQTLGVVTGGVQGLAAVFNIKFLAKAPGLGELIGNFSTSAMSRMIQRVGISGAEAALNTAVAFSAFPKISEKIAAQWDATVPNHPWSEINKEFWTTAGSAFCDFFPMVALGAGFAHFSDIRNAREIAQDPAKMRALGFAEDDIKNVMAQTTDKGAGQACMEGFARRKPILKGDSRAAGLAEANERARRAAEEGFELPEEAKAADREAMARQQAADAGVTMRRDEDGWHVGESSPDKPDGGKTVNVGDEAKNAIQARDMLTEEKHAEENEAFSEEVKKAETESESVKENEDDSGSVKTDGISPDKKNEEISSQEEPLSTEPHELPGREVPEIELAKPEAGAETPESARASAHEEVSDASEGQASAAKPESGAPQVATGTSNPASEAGAPETRGNTSFAELDKAAKEFGLGDVPREEKWKARDELLKAKEIVDKNPRAGEELVAELKAKPRTLDPVERFVFNHEFERLKSELRDAVKEKNAGGGDKASARIEDLENKLQDLREAGFRAGSLAGSALKAIDFAQAKDFSLEGMRSYYRARYNDGKPLNEKQSKLVKKLHDELAAKDKALADYKAETDALTMKLAAMSHAKEQKATARKTARGEKIKGEQSYREALLKKIREKQSEVGAGFAWADPEYVANAVKIVASLIREGYHKVADFIEAMKQEGFGELSEKDVERLMEMAEKEKPSEKEIPLRDDGEWKGTGMHNYTILEPGAETTLTVSEGTPMAEIQERAREKVKQFKEGVLAKGIEAAKQSRENSMQAIRDLQKRVGSGTDKIPELVYHSAKVAASLALEFGLKGAELAKRTLEELGSWAKEYIDAIMDLAETFRDKDVTKEVGEEVARAEDFAKRVEEEGSKAAQAARKKASDDLIREVGEENARGEKFQRRLEKQAQAAEEKARKEASDKLIKEVGRETASREDVLKRLQGMEAKIAEQEAAAVEAYKRDVIKRTAEIRERIIAGEFGPKVKKELGKRDEETLRLLAEKNAVVLEWERAKERARLENRGKIEKTLDAVADAKRVAILSSVPVAFKLAAASTELMILTPIEAAGGGVLSKLPLLRSVAARAPRYGRFSLSVEGKALAEGVSNWVNDAKSIWKRGKTDYELRYGDGQKIHTGKGLGEILGRLHAILKAPAARQEFARSFKYREEYYDKMNLPVSGEEMQTRIGLEAVLDAGRSIFKNDNPAVNLYNRFIVSGLKSIADKRKEAKDPYGETIARGFQLLFKEALPIVKIPTNIFARMAEHALGTGSGLIRLLVAGFKGLKNIEPSQADLIMQNLRRGNIGLAFLLYGYFNPGVAGGYFQKGKYPGEDDADFGELKIGGVKVPKLLVHNPLLEMIQVGATIAKVREERKSKLNPEQKGLYDATYKAFLGLVEEVPFVSELKHVADTVLNEHDKRSFIGELLKSHIPAVIQQGAAMVDPLKDKKDAKGKPVRRDPEGIGETIEMGIPGLRNTIPTGPERKKQEAADRAKAYRESHAVTP